MAVREIITPANPILRHKARPVTAMTPALQTLIDDMVETMQAAQGVGLAGPQVAESLRLFVACLEEEPQLDEEEAAPPPQPPGVGRLHVMINPEIVRASREMVTGVEGCLSIPGYAGDVERHQAITIRYQDRHGQKRKLKTFGWMARVLQHEYDHLDGVLFIDRAADVWSTDPEPEPQAEGNYSA